MTRSRGDHLNTAEMKIIRDGFASGIPGNQIAVQLGCSRQAVNAHYRKLTAEAAARSAVKPGRFYRSEFVAR